MSEVIVVTSGNGGAGQTMFAANFASVLAMSECRVLLMDMNAGLRNLDIVMGVEDRVVYDISDVINGTCSLSKALIRDERFESLYLLSASQNVNKEQVTEEQMEQICRVISGQFDFVIIDAPAGLGEDWRIAVSQADLAVVLVTQEYSSIREADSIDLNLRKCGVKKRFAVINRVRREDFEKDCFPSLEEIDRSLRLPIAGGIIFDENVHLSMSSGIPVVCKKNSYITRNFKRIFLRMYSDKTR